MGRREGDFTRDGRWLGYEDGWEGVMFTSFFFPDGLFLGLLIR
jgi:hypothetical protein